MPNLEQLIAQWRATMMAAPEVNRETLHELEDHLREHAGQLVQSGWPEPEAFQSAVARLGDARTLGSEFRKLNQSTWLPVKVVAGLGAAAALAMAIFVMTRLGSGRTGVLLASHVFLVTLGYLSTFLAGALGICFVSQRSVSDFPAWRLASLKRATGILGLVAAGLTAPGVILGMIWTKIEWGRLWAWDVMETGAFAVMVWQVCFLCAHRLPWGSARGLLAFSLLGNMVVLLGWFGANLLRGLHGYGTPNSWALLLAALACNLVFFCIGWAPAGWLRPRHTP